MQAANPAAAPAALIDDYLAFVLRRDPIEASQLGVRTHDRELGDYAAEAYADEIVQRRRYAERFAAVDPAALDADAALDLAVARIDVGTALRRLEDLQVWARAPYWYVERLGAALSAVMRASELPHDEQGDRLLARLAQAPAYLAAAQRSLTPETAPLHVEMGLTAIKGLRRFLSSAAPGFAAALAPSLQADIGRATGSALDALAAYEGFLQMFHAQAQGSFACGPEHFDYLLAHFHLLDHDHRSLYEFGLAQMAADKARLERAAQRLDPSRTWVEQIERIKDEHPQGDALLKTYRDEMARARGHCVAADLIMLPAGEISRVEWLPDYLRAGAPLGLMFTTPPFAPGLESELVITPLDAEAPPEQQRQHLRDHCYAFARSITLHEIYPGHHTQMVHHKLATAHSRMRRAFSSPVFVEGWGLYTEDLMEETGFMAEPAVQLFKLRNALWRSVRVVVDSGLHTRGMSFEEAVTLMCDEVWLDRRMAEGEVRRYTTHDNPTYPSAYLLGKNAIQELRRQWRAQQGDAFTLKRFHDTLLSFGSPPVKLVAARMLEVAPQSGNARIDTRE